MADTETLPALPEAVARRLDEYREKIRHAERERRHRTEYAQRELNDAEHAARAALLASLAPLLRDAERYAFLREQQVREIAPRIMGGPPDPADFDKVVDDMRRAAARTPEQAAFETGRYSVPEPQGGQPMTASEGSITPIPGACVPAARGPGVVAFHGRWFCSSCGRLHGTEHAEDCYYRAEAEREEAVGVPSAKLREQILRDPDDAVVETGVVDTHCPGPVGVPTSEEPRDEPFVRRATRRGIPAGPITPEEAAELRAPTPPEEPAPR